MNDYGNTLLRFFRGAREEALIVAPFMRADPLDRLLDAVDPGVHTQVVCRWEIRDLLAGVSELGCLDVAKAHGVPLFLRPQLHAKLFVADHQCLVGSANVTGSGLGWSSANNLELLVEAPRSDSAVANFERTVFASAVEATETHRRRLEAVVAIKGRDLPEVVGPVLSGGSGHPLPGWFPRIMNPEQLFDLYCGNSNRIDHTVLPSMHQELKQIHVPEGLTKSEFRDWVAASVSQTHVISWLLQEIAAQRDVTDKRLDAFLERLDMRPSGSTSNEMIRCLGRWMSYFFGSDFRVVQESLKIVKLGADVPVP